MGWLSSLVDDELRQRAARLPSPVNEYGYDAWGFHRDTYLEAMALGRWFYRHYFRCRSIGHEHLPRGRVLFIANHAGQLPADAAMLGLALFLEPDPPRAVRGMVEKLAARTPFVSEWFVRLGQLTGTPENCRQMLGEERAVMVFPEGLRGIKKTWSERYRLAEFGTGFLRLALETQTPIVPVGLVGFEESVPTLAQLMPLARALGLPYFPLTPTLLPFPLPTRCQIRFGRPIHFRGHPQDDERQIHAKVERVKRELRKLIAAGLKERKSIF